MPRLVKNPKRHEVTIRKVKPRKRPTKMPEAHTAPKKRAKA